MHFNQLELKLLLKYR